MPNMNTGHGDAFSDEQGIELIALFEPWQSGTAYAISDRRRHGETGSTSAYRRTRRNRTGRLTLFPRFGR